MSWSARGGRPQTNVLSESLRWGSSGTAYPDTPPPTPAPPELGIYKETLEGLPVRQKGDWQTPVSQKLGESFLEGEARQGRRGLSCVSVNRSQATILQGRECSRKSRNPGGGSGSRQEMRRGESERRFVVKGRKGDL